MESESIANTSDLNTLSLHTHTQLRVVSDTSLYDVCNVFESLGKVFESVVTQGNVVGEMGVIA